MEEQHPSQVRIDYVVGAEKKLSELISAAEVIALLQGMVAAGARRAAILTAEGELLWSRGEVGTPAPTCIIRPLTLEGEEIGSILIEGDRGEEHSLTNLTGLLQTAIATILVNNLKRMLTTEIHTTVVNQSYDELLAANRNLAASESKYRHLAAQLESKVEERTAALRNLHGQLLLREKMTAVGQLAAGLAHEINNPLGYIASNLNSLRNYVARFSQMITFYRDIFSRLQLDAATATLLAEKWRQLKLELIQADVEDLLLQSQSGCERIARIVADLKGFSHLDDDGLETSVDLNRELELTLQVLQAQIPADAIIEKNYAPLPPFSCKPAQLCQSFYNIILNAMQAKPIGLHLRISSEARAGALQLIFADNGPGMAPEVCRRVFEPFFTTREVGGGTGLGLTTAYETVTAQGGTIEAQSQEGQGTTIIITFPLKGR